MFRTTLALVGTIVIATCTSQASAVALNANQLNLAGPQPGGKQKGADRFERLDRNDDGVIDREEFDRARKGRRGQRGPEARGKRRGPDGPPHAERGRWGPGGRRGPAAHGGRGFGGHWHGMMGHRHQLRRMIRQEIRRAMMRMHHRGMRGGHGGPGINRGGRHGGFGGPGGPGMDARFERRGGGGGPGPRGLRSQRRACPNCRFAMNDDARPPMAGPRGDRPRGEGFRGGPGGPDGPGVQGGDGPPRGRGFKKGGAGRGGKGKRGRGGLRQRFEKLDRNNDGAIDRDEFKGPPERFDRLDKNDDGRIEKDELPRGRGKGGRGRPQRSQV